MKLKYTFRQGRGFSYQENNRTREAFTLIEVIFTIVIMAGIFMVIPKILMMVNKTESFAMKQDAYFNAISITKLASTLAWDENNTESLNTLNTTINNINCNGSTNYIRIGSFLSANGRTCQDSLSASAIMSDAGEDDYLFFDDIDDFNGSIINTTENGNNRYKILTHVSYLNHLNLFATEKKLTIDLSATTDTGATSNIKKLTTTIKYNGKKAVNKDKTIATFRYYSANIGQFTLNKREW